MAYTYDDFYKEAESAGMLNRFSQYDLETAKKDPEFGRAMLGFKLDYDNAANDEQRLLANAGANQLRSRYGSYTGGDTGMDYIYSGSSGDKVNSTLSQLENYGSFDYSREDDVQKLIDTVLNQQPFSYDPGADPLYSSYKKSYLREGERATANALAQASAATGGVPSSWAVTAAQQAGSYYGAQLNDKIPELEQQAYARYQGDITQKLNTLGALQSDRSQEHGEWQTNYNMLLNLLSGYQTQDQIEYGRFADGRNWAYQQEQADIQNQMTAQQLEDQRRQQEWDNAMAMYQILGYATPEIAAILGIPQSGGGDDGGSVGYWNPNPTPNPDTDLTDPGTELPQFTGNGDKVEGYVENLLSGSADNRSYAANIILNSNNLTADEKNYALEILGVYRQYGV